MSVCGGMSFADVIGQCVIVRREGQTGIYSGLVMETGRGNGMTCEISRAWRARDGYGVKGNEISWQWEKYALSYYCVVMLASETRQSAGMGISSDLAQ